MKGKYMMKLIKTLAATTVLVLAATQISASSYTYYSTPNVFGGYNATTEVESDAPIADKFELHGNFPNPFNPVTKIRFSTERESLVKVTIFSILGEEISVVENSQLNAGTYNITWYGKDSKGDKVPSGLYFYEVKSDNRIQKGLGLETFLNSCDKDN